MGGLSCAAALAKTGYRVLVLEQHSVAGGLTQTFSRAGFTWNVGVHYLGEMAPNGGARVVLDWLCDGKVPMASMGAVYDSLHFPDGYEVRFSAPETALKVELKEKFPESAAEIDGFFDILPEAEHAGQAIFTQRAMPGVLSSISGLWHRAAVNRWWGRTCVEVLSELIRDPKLRAILLAQRGNYGDPSESSSFGLHAMVMRHYLSGAYYPEGGSSAFAHAMVPVVMRAGGEIRLGTRVEHLLLESDAVVGVQCADGSVVRSPCVFSDAGVLNTVGRLLQGPLRDSAWAREVLSFKPSVCHIGLYLGFEGDVRAHGADTSNHWFHDSWALDAGLWTDPFAQEGPTSMFVSFPTLKDPCHDAGPRQRYTAELVVMTTWDAFSQWQESSLAHRPGAYIAFKAHLTRKLLDHFNRKFPGLGPLIVFHELSTPLTTAAYVGTPKGAIYGLETSPRRFLSSSLRPRTPVPGLFLTGQDVAGPGLTGAMMGGVLAAASIEPRVHSHLH